jgi:hypothetical protein
MSGSFGITYEQLLSKLFLPAGPSATKHGPNIGQAKFLPSIWFASKICEPFGIGMLNLG